jgi:nucleotide-binding universal stress UspA family protein
MPRTAVVGYDGSDQANAALDLAVDLVKSCGGGKVVVTCGQNRQPGWWGYTYRGPVPGREEYLDELEAQIASDLETAAEKVRQAGVDAATACTRQHPVDTLLTVAADVGADFIVVGATGSGRSDENILGSTATRLLHKSSIPVIVVPERG